jgi:hypothetical protein
MTERDWMTALLPVVGIVIGAALHYWFAKTHEREKQTHTLRDQAYADYLQVIARMAVVQQAGRERDEELQWRVIDAKARIAIYGSTRVGEALASFERKGAVFDGGGVEHFLTLCQAMRADSASGERALSRQDIAAILLASKRRS